MSRVLAAAGGFILAVLWMDLMFDVQTFRRSARSGVLPDDVLTSIAAYYQRVITDSYPMAHLIRAVMIVMVGGSASQLFRGAGPRWARVLAVVLCSAPIALAAVRIVPSAVRLGTRVGSVEEQSRLARDIGRAHVVCFIAISLFVVLQFCAG